MTADRRSARAVPHRLSHVSRRVAWLRCETRSGAAAYVFDGRRDMLLLAGLLLLALTITWVGTEYVLNHVVIPLIDD